MGYLKDTISGVSWMGVLRASTRGLTFVKIAVLARLLTPNEFGLFGIAMLALAFLEIITETGINIFLIQEKADLRQYNNTAWVVSIARGFLMFLAILLFAPFISSFFKSPGATNLLYLTSLIPLIRGFINPAIVRFQKELKFNKEFYLRLGLFSVDFLVAIGLGIATRSATSFVWGMLAASVIEALYSLLFIKPKPQFVFDGVKAKEVITRGKWITLAGVFNYLFENVDDAAVGRLVNTASLGVYQLAYKISSLPITEVADVVSKVTFPVYVKISGDGTRLKEAFLKTFLATCALALPIGLFLYFFTDTIVLTLLGPQWLDTISVVKVLAFFGVVRGATFATYPLFLSLKKQSYVMATTLVGILGLGLFVVPMVSRYGVLGAAYSALIGAFLSVPVATYFVFKIFRDLK